MATAVKIEESSLPDIVAISRSSSISPTTSDESGKSCAIVRDGVVKEISKYVLRQKLNKLRHLVIKKGISPEYLDSIFPEMLEYFDPHHVVYNGGIVSYVFRQWMKSMIDTF